jgi:hypothetical protein
MPTNNFDEPIATTYEGQMAGAVPANRHQPDSGLPRRPRRNGAALELGIGTGRIALPCLPPGETIHPFAVTTTHLGFEEYDFAAQMTLRERWSDWHRQPFTGESRSHVSVWERTGTVLRMGQSYQ